MKDIHGDYGEFCYKGFRHSLCHVTQIESPEGISVIKQQERND